MAIEASERGRRLMRRRPLPNGEGDETPGRQAPPTDAEIQKATRHLLLPLGRLVREIAVARGLTPEELLAELGRRGRRG